MTTLDLIELDYPPKRDCDVELHDGTRLTFSHRSKRYNTAFYTAPAIEQPFSSNDFEPTVLRKKV